VVLSLDHLRAARVKGVLVMIEAIKSGWWLLLLRGFLAVAVGVIAFVQPAGTLTALVIVLGAYFFVIGIVAFTAAWQVAPGDRWWALLIEGILGIVAALLIWSWPQASTEAFVYFIAAWFILSGIVQIAAGVRLRDVIDNEWLYILGGVITVAFGVWVFRSPSQGTVATAYIFGIYFLLYGIVQLALAYKLRSLQGDVTKLIKGS
jgi:uncharacterized membrane protein HdeD (DUF308 family)